MVDQKRNTSSAEAEMKTGGGLPPIAKNQQHSEDDIDVFNVASSFGPILSDVQAFIRDLDIITLEGEGLKMSCGMNKCWIPSKSHPDYGYTIGQDYSKYNIESMTTGWEYSNMLQQKYNGNSNTTTTNLYPHDCPPQVLAKSDNLTAFLNTGLHALPIRTNKRLYNKDQEFIVQVMRKMPTGSMLIRPRPTEDEFREKILARLPAWMKLNVVNETLFVETLQHSQMQLHMLIEQEPLLLNDFQFLLDPTGRILHLDLDRIENGHHVFSPSIVASRVDLFVQEVTALVLAKKEDNNRTTTAQQ
jgi:hypothetical protein